MKLFRFISMIVMFMLSIIHIIEYWDKVPIFIHIIYLTIIIVGSIINIFDLLNISINIRRKDNV